MRYLGILGALIAACSYDDYNSRSLQEHPSSEAGPDGAPGNGGSGGNAGGTGGQIQGRDASSDPSDAMPDVRSGEASPPGAAGSQQGADAEPRDAVALDAVVGAPPDAVVDAPRDGAPNGDVVVTFESANSLFDFTFWTAPTATGGPGTWLWVPGEDPHLVQATNVSSGGYHTGAGTYAIYEKTTIRDGYVSVRLWSGDTDSGDVIIRYVDETNYYRFRVGAELSPYGKLQRHSGDQLVVLGTNDTPYNHDAPGHTLKLEAVGAVLRAYVDGALWIEAADPNPLLEGKVGLETVALFDAHFDDFTVVHYR